MSFFLFPLSASVEILDYTMEFRTELDMDFSSIKAKYLLLTVVNRVGSDPTDLLLSLFRGLTELGHFEVLRFHFYGLRPGYKIPKKLGGKMIRSITANRPLRKLDLNKGQLDWTPFEF